jgi:signal transduction histidine kinase
MRRGRVWEFRSSRLSIRRGGSRRWCCSPLSPCLWWAIRLRIASIARQLQDRLAERVAERERIARELHDTLLQSLFGLTLRFHTAASRLPADDPAREALDEALKQSDRVMQEGRERVLNLRGRHTDSASLADALAETGNQLRAIHPANFEISVEGRPRPLDEIVQEEILLIGREALTNAFSHSGAQNIVAEIVIPARRSARARAR